MDAGRHARLRGWRAAVATVLAMAVGAAACSGIPRGVLVRGSSPTPGTARAAPPGSIDAFVPEAERFVEAHRGLRYKQPVQVRHLADQAFSDRIMQLQRSDHADLDRQAKVLRAVGLLQPGVDAEAKEEELLGAGVVGYYDPKTKELVVRGDTATLAVRHVVVHELTHAVQDQWFSLGDRSTGNDDADIAYTALVEGDAVRIEDEYVSSLSDADRRRLRSQDAAAGGTPPSDVPRVLEELLSFPYVAGPPFTQAVIQARGQKGLDDVFRSHPAASSQVLHPEAFLGGDTPVKVDDPAAGGPVFDRGTLGELGLDLVLEDLLRSGGLTSAQVRSATTGWAGDRYVAWTQGDGFCMRDRFATRTAGDAAALVTALRRFAGSRPGVTLEAGAQPVLTSCG